MSKDINCPYCGKEIDINHDEGQGCTEEEIHQQQCPECEKYFVFTTSISFYYEPDKADCLNDGNHNYQPTVTNPKICTIMRCSMCDEERSPTKEEWLTILLPKELQEAKNKYPEIKWIQNL